MAELTPDQVLALAYVPASRRDAVRALWQLDAILASAALSGREPMVRRIKLAWWREALEKLDSAPAPAEPTLQALAAHVLAQGVSGAELARLEESWAYAAQDDAAAGQHGTRGRTLFALTARLLGFEADERQQQAGEGWARVDLARRTGADPCAAKGSVPALRWPAKLRPLGMLAVLARGDAEKGLRPQGSPGRMLRMALHRLTGR